MRKILMILILITMMTVLTFSGDKGNEFPADPKVEPQPGDEDFITEDYEVTVGMLRQALFVQDLYFLIHDAYTEAKSLYLEAEADNDLLLVDNVRLTRERNAMIGVSGVLVFGILVTILILK